VPTAFLAAFTLFGALFGALSGSHLRGHLTLTRAGQTDREVSVQRRLERSAL